MFKIFIEIVTGLIDFKNTLLTTSNGGPICVSCIIFDQNHLNVAAIVLESRSDTIVADLFVCRRRSKTFFYKRLAGSNGIIFCFIASC